MERRYRVMEIIRDTLTDPEVRFVIFMMIAMVASYILGKIHDWKLELDEKRKKNSIYYKRNERS